LKNRKSLFVIFVVLFSFVACRLIHLQNYSNDNYKVTAWDAFGYYMYLPSAFIYKDIKSLKWVDSIDRKYAVTGGQFYQASLLKTGTYTNKYLCGVAILQIPYFYIGHLIAYYTGSLQDGFSWPYQYALMFGAIIWAFVGFVFLRKVLLRYFNDEVAATTLILLALGSNLIQYVSIDAAQSHVYIFTLYAIVLWLTIKWHERPKHKYAFLIGLTCGLAVISRPTELIIIFLPILWGMNTAIARKEKWALVIQQKKQILTSVLGGLMAILPQLLYWNYTTGSLIFDVGSKWYFLNPWFRVLFGPEKGWFLYTPIALLMFVGLWFIKKHPFQKAVITFCLLNIWIIIAWSDWRYGGSYSTRALTQSYPVFALSLAAVINVFIERKRRVILAVISLFLIILNGYQLHLYNSGIGDSFSPLLKLFVIA
jgi:hypothetical protein